MELSCPMPKLDFDLITLGHGSGGILTHKLLDAGVFDLLKNDKPEMKTVEQQQQQKRVCMPHAT